MPATFTGIRNENEFYSHHYLAELFANDLQATTARWHESAAGNADGARTPDQALRALARPYLRFRQEFGRERRFNFAPERVTAAGPGAVYHFLLPDPGMADYRNKAAMRYEPANFARIKAWRKAFCRPFAEEEIAELEALSARVDALWALHTEQLARDRRETEDTLPVWGSEGATLPRRTSNHWKDRIRDQGMLGRGTRTVGPYRRLKLVMDYWCALWFWPIGKADDLPTRDEFLNEVSLVLKGSVFQPGLGPNQTRDLFGAEYAEHADEIAKRITNEIGMLDLDRLFEQFPRLKFVDELASQRHFHHWELAFADLFYAEHSDGRPRGGFDLVLGNPPWIKVQWQEAGVLGDFDPSLVLRKHSAVELTRGRDEAFERYGGLRGAWMGDVEDSEATQAFLNATQNYPALARQQTNLFKCFLPQAWMTGSENGVAGFLHPEGIYDDPKGGAFRREVYSRLRSHFQFANEKKLFSEIHHHTEFSVNIYGRQLAAPRFRHIANLYAPATIDASFSHDGGGNVPGLKDDEGNWNTNGHSARALEVNEAALGVFASLYNESGSLPIEARLPALHSRELPSVVAKLADHRRRLADVQGEFFKTEHWHETNAQHDGAIRRETRFPKVPDERVVSGPHFFVGNPFNKTPRERCTRNSDYDCLDLIMLPDDYLPRTNYVPACDDDEYERRTPKVSWPEDDSSEKANVTNFYRMTNRRMVGPTAERTFISALVPKGVANINPNVA